MTEYWSLADGVPNEEAYSANQHWWNEITGPHERSDFYDVAGFKAGQNKIPAYIQNEVGDVAGKSLLHVQCHFGIDTLCWARLGASVTGVDFGGEAIKVARRLAEDEGADARFVHSNIYDLGDRFDDQFDIVFTSYGVLAWLNDIPEWGRTVASAVKPGGIFYIAEFHPFMDTIQDVAQIASPKDVYPMYPYFDPGEAVLLGAQDGADYASSARVEQATYEWFHSMDDILSALLDAGLQIEMFHEQDFCSYRSKMGLVQGRDRMWRMPEPVQPMPMMFSVKARKPG